MISDNTQAKPLDKTAVSRSCGNIKFTKNTEQTRIWLKAKGFKGLSFFQGKTYIYAFLRKEDMLEAVELYLDIYKKSRL